MIENVTFGRIEVRPSQRQLRVDGHSVPLGARAFDVLLALVERRDRVVSKAELLDLAWPGLIVEENNLSVQISVLRKALGTQAIATVTGRGYRFALSPQASVIGEPRPEASGRIVRRVTALAFGELIGWKRSLHDQPDDTVSAWQAARSEVIETGVPEMGGRIIELAPEGMWIEFASAVDALRWANGLNRELASLHARTGAPRLEFRIAVSVEDVIIDEGRPVGDGAQAAARLLAAAPSDAKVVVTESARATLGARSQLRFVPFGSPPQGWRVEDRQPETDLATSSPSLRAGGLVSQRPAVAVLPFDSGDEALYFGDGITEEIISTLAANRTLLVIARSSTLRYRGSTLQPAEIAAELGVRYLLCGMVKRVDQRLRLVAELVDAQTNRVIWSQRYDGAEGRLFEFQSEIASSIAGAIDPRVTEAEFERVARVPTDSLSAYDCVLHGLSLQVTFREGDFAAAGEYFRRAIEIDPGYAQAHAHLAWWHNLRVGEGRSIHLDADAQASEKLSMRAMALDPRDALVMAIAAHIQAFVKRRLLIARDMFEQALEINPSCAFGWARSATTAAYLGRGDEAQERILMAIRLSPFDQQGFTFLTTRGTASLVQGNFDEAAVWYGKARRANPGYKASWRMLIAALALAGEINEARAQAAEFLNYDPDFRVSAFSSWYPMKEPHLGTVLRGMRLAGLPD